MAISGLDLNLIHRAGAGRRGLFVVVAADTVCAGHAVCGHAPLLVQAGSGPDVDPMEGCPPCPSGSDRSGYGQARPQAPAGTGLDLLC